MILKRLIAWAVFLAVVLGVVKLAHSVGNPFSAEAVFSPARQVVPGVVLDGGALVDPLHIPGCADHPADCEGTQ